MNPKFNGQTLPWTKSCFVCGQENPQGLRLRAHIKDNRVIIEHTTRPSDAGYPKIVHGGIGATLLDEVMTWAAILEGAQFYVAAEFTIRLTNPIQIGEKIRTEGWVTQKRSKLMMAEGLILNEAGRVLMKATGKFLPMNAQTSQHVRQDFIFSPDTITPELISQGNQ